MTTFNDPWWKQPQHPQDVIDSEIMKVMSPVARNLRAARLAATTPADLIRSISPVQRAGGGQSYYLDIETLGIQRDLPILNAAFASATELKDLNRLGRAKAMEKAGEKFTNLILPDIVTSGGIESMGNLTQGQREILKKKLTGAYEWKSEGGKMSLEDMMMAQFKPEFIQSLQGRTELVIDHLASTLKSDPSGAGLAKIMKAGGAPSKYKDYIKNAVKRVSSEGGGSIVIHNMGFEMGFLAERMGRAEFLNDMAPYLYEYSVKHGEALGQVYTGSEISLASAIMRQRAKLKGKFEFEDAERLFHSIQKYRATDSKGLVKFVDSMDIFHSVIGMAEGKGFLDPTGTLHGAKIDDFLKAMGMNEHHIAGGDIHATEWLDSYLTSLGQKLVHAKTKADLGQDFSTFLAKLGDIRNDMGRREGDILGTLSEHIARTLEGRSIRVPPDKIEAYYRQAVMYSPSQGKKIIEPIPALGPAYPEQHLTVDQIFDLQWGRMGGLRQSYGKERFEKLRAAAKEMWDDQKFKNEAALKYGNAADDIERYAAETINQADVYARLRTALKSPNVPPIIGKAATEAEEAAGKLSKVGWAKGLTLGLAAGTAISYLIPSPAAVQSDQLSSGRGPVFSNLLGVGAAAAAIGYTATHGTSYAFPKGGSLIERLYAYGPRTGAVMMAGFAAVAASHDLFAEDKPAIGGALSMGLVAGGFAIASNVSKRSLQDTLTKTIEKVPNLKLKLEAAKNASPVIKALGEHPWLSAVAGVAALAYFGSGMLDRDRQTVQDGMPDEGYKGPRRGLSTDFGSKLNPSKISAMLNIKLLKGNVPYMKGGWTNIPKDAIKYLTHAPSGMWDYGMKPGTAPEKYMFKIPPGYKGKAYGTPDVYKAADLKSVHQFVPQSIKRPVLFDPMRDVPPPSPSKEISTKAVEAGQSVRPHGTMVRGRSLKYEGAHGGQYHKWKQSGVPHSNGKRPNEAWL